MTVTYTPEASEVFANALATCTDALSDERLTFDERRRIAKSLHMAFCVPPTDEEIPPTVRAMVKSARCGLCGVPLAEHQTRGCDDGCTREELLRRVRALREESEQC